MADKTGQRGDYETAANVGMLIERITEKVGWELSGECWL
jgi:hypothetical protein